ncbi:hypothetical protein RI367_008854, partial [Sorochytrium milnesiophthora]
MPTSKKLTTAADAAASPVSTPNSAEHPPQRTYERWTTQELDAVMQWLAVPQNAALYRKGTKTAAYKKMQLLLPDKSVAAIGSKLQELLKKFRDAHRDLIQNTGA